MYFFFFNLTFFFIVPAKTLEIYLVQSIQICYFIHFRRIPVMTDTIYFPDKTSTSTIFTFLLAIAQQENLI